jgi:hypothetical protein
MLSAAFVKSMLAQVIVRAESTSSFPMEDVVLRLSGDEFLQWLNSQKESGLEVMCNKEKLAWQKMDADDNGTYDCLLVLANFQASEKKTIQIKSISQIQSAFPKRTQAELSIKEGGEWKIVTKDNGKQQNEYEGGSFINVSELRVPDEHTDHSFYIRYEGPGWESDKIAYRFYLDWRNAIDLFGKKTPEMVLQNVGQDGFESYHSESDWGMDVLKVGASLGLGTFGWWDGSRAQRVEKTDSIFCKISENGILESEITTYYYGWKDAGYPIQLTSVLSIQAGSRLTRVDLILSDSLSNLCTGIVKLDAGELIKGKTVNTHWSYIATFGMQSLNNDNLGLVIFYQTEDLLEITDDSQSHVLVLRPENKHVSYYLAATWEKDSEGIKTKEDFIQYLDKTLETLNNPVKLSYK